MQYFARVVNGVVVEIITLPAGVTPAQAFAPPIASTLVACPSTTVVGQAYFNGGFGAAAVPTLTSAELTAYAMSKQARIAAGGISVNVGGTAGTVKASTDAGSLTLLQGAYSVAQANSAASFGWVQNNAVAVTLTASQIITIYNTVTAFIQSTFTSLTQVLAAITAGSIKTQAQVDIPPSPIPAWPANS